MKRNGLMLTAGIALAAMVLGYYVPLVGSPIFSILLGILIAQLIRLPESFVPGIKFSGKKILQWAIIVMGFTLSFRSALSLGLSSLPITLTTITAALLTSYFIGRLMNIPSKLRTLIGVGTAICGGSAIAAASPIVQADEEEIAFSISTIFLFNIIAVFTFPLLGHLLNMSSQGFGYFAGAAINDTSSVVAAGYTYSKSAGDTAVIVKLVRAMMIVPVCMLLAAVQIKKNKSAANISLTKIFPWFILYFFLASLFVTLVPVPTEVTSIIKVIATFMITMALAGIGLSVNLKSFRTIGYQPVLLGALTWAVVTITTIAMQLLLHIW